MKKILSLSLALLLLCSATVMPAHAADLTINSAGGSQTVPVVLEVEPATFSVTVPTTLPVRIDEDGLVTTPDTGATIINNSAAPVAVANVTVTAADTWQLIDFTTDPATFKVNEHKLGLKLNGVATGANGAWTFDASKWSVIAAKGGQYNFTYEAILPPQTNDSNGATMANVVFTIGWAQ